MSGIQMALLGAAGVADVVNFVDASVISSNTAVSTAGYRVNTDGFDYQGVQGVFTVLSQWVTPASAGGDYEVFATRSGDAGGGTTGSWVATSTNPTWTLTSATIGTPKFSTLAMQVRKVGSGTVLDTWTVNLEAERI